MSNTTDYPNQDKNTNLNKSYDYDGINLYEIAALYADIYISFQKEFDITCSLGGFNDFIDRDEFTKDIALKIKSSGGKHEDDLAPIILAHMSKGVKYVSPAVTQINPSGVSAAMLNISKLVWPRTTLQAEYAASMFGVDLESTIENISAKIGEGMRSRSVKMGGGANIFSNRGRGGSNGGGDTNDEGNIIYPDGKPNNYTHHEVTKNELRWDLGLENTSQGTEPFWQSGLTRTCFVGKTNMIQFPNDDLFLEEYYRDTLIYVLKNAIQGNKRYNANLSEVMTYERFRAYINRMIHAVAVYFWFANGYAYCNQPGLVNNNEALRYIRNELFTTVQLQRFQQLGQMLDSFPLPQTLINSIAQYHGWYSNSECPNSTLYCNIPHGIFIDNAVTMPVAQQSGSANALDRFQPDIIKNMIDMLDTPIILAEASGASDRFLGILLNTIPGWRESSVSGSFFDTDVYDEANWNEFMNSPTIVEVTTYPNEQNQTVTTRTMTPEYKGEDANSPYRTIGTNTPGYLQSYFTPVSWDQTTSSYKFHGIIKAQGLNVNSRMAYYIDPNRAVECQIYSNVVVWTNDRFLFTHEGYLTNRGFTLYPSSVTQNFNSNIASPLSWHFDNGERPGMQGYTDTYGTVSTILQQPICTQDTVNMSLTQTRENRLLALQKLLDVQDFYNVVNPIGNKERKFSRRGRKGKSESTSEEKSD